MRGLTSGDIYFMPSWAQTFSNGQCETLESASGSGATRKGVSVVGQQAGSPRPASILFRNCLASTACP